MRCVAHAPPPQRSPPAAKSTADLSEYRYNDLSKYRYDHMRTCVCEPCFVESGSLQDLNAY